MGVSGSGKTTVGKLLASKLNLPFLDADDYHTPESTDKMSRGIPLNDQDRSPWLATLQRILIKDHRVVMACSALKQSYRSTLDPDQHLTWVYLEGSEELIQTRLCQRKGHFMKANMLASQFSTLEIPESVLKADINDAPTTIIKKLLPHIP